MSTVKMQLRLAPEVVARFDGLTPRLRSRAVAAAITGASEGVDLHALLGAVEELRRAGVNLNQALHIAHIRGAVTPELLGRVEDFLALVERLRGVN